MPEARTGLADLQGVAALGRLTLSARARAVRVRGTPEADPAIAAFTDPEASEAAGRLGLAVTQDAAFTRGVVLRSLWFDQMASRFLMDHPDGQVVSLGAGLCTRWRRLNTGLPSLAATDWLNIDLPDVIAWRRRCVMPGPRERDVAGSVLDLAWLAHADPQAGRPALVLLEGVCPYLPHAPLSHMLTALATHLAAHDIPAWLVADFIHPDLVRRPMQVDGIVLPVLSGFRDVDEVSGLHPSMRLLEQQQPFARFSEGHRQFADGFQALHGCAPYTWACLAMGAPR